MSKTCKMCAIFFGTAVWLVVMRIVASYMNFGDYINDWVFSFLMQVIGLGLLPMLAYRLWVKEDILTGFSMKAKISPAIYLIAVFLGFFVSLLLMAVSSVYQVVLGLLGYTYGNSAGVVYSNFGVLVMELLASAVLPAVFEELTYRGLGRRMLGNVKNEKAVIILTALLFGLGHQYIVQTLYAFVAGLILGYLAVKTKSVFPGMIVHFINNAVGIIDEFSEQHNGIWATVQGAITEVIFQNWLVVVFFIVMDTIVICLLLRLVKRLCKEKREEIAEEGGYYYPDKMQYVDDLFGVPTVQPEKKNRKKKSKPCEYAFLYGTFVLMSLVTFFSFVWGMWR